MMKLIYLNKESVNKDLCREIERRIWIAVGIFDHDADFQELYESYCEQRRANIVKDYMHFNI